jgi:two-component system, OmpR family, response regulator
MIFRTAVPLVLSAPSRPLLTAELLRPGASGIFVQTNDALPAGSAVQLVVQIKDEKLGTGLEAKVLSFTERGPGGYAGVFVSLAADQQQKAKEFLGLVPTSDHPARLEVRVDCQLPLRLLNPADPNLAHTKNVSRNGILATCGAALAAGQVVQIALELNANETLEARCKVMWSRPELKLAGLRFEGLSADDLKRLDALVAALTAPQEAPRPAPRGKEEVTAWPDVLVADDEPSVALFIERIVQKLGLKVVTFDRGDLALKAIRAQRPRLVMLDVLMPGLDGLQVCSLIRADAMLARTPVVLLSALEGEKIRKIAEEARATAWLQKPLDLAAVRKLIVDTLNAARKQGP